MPLHLLPYLFYLESGTYSGYVLGLSEVKVGRKKDPLKSPTKHFEFTLQSKRVEKRVVCFSPQKRRLILEAADRDDIGSEVGNTKKNKCSEIVMNDYSLLEKNPLSYKREKQDCKYTTTDACTNSCEMYQTVNIKAVLQSVSEPQTVQYGGREMIIQKAVAADKSEAMGIRFHSQLVDKVE